MKNSLENTSRRDFLVKSAATSGALAIGFTLPGLANGAPAPDYGSEVTHWVVIQPDDTVVIRIARSELGQGSFTGLAQLVAEELQCDWSKVQPVYADVNMHIKRNRIFKSMSTGGSRSIRDSQEYIRKAGAAARQMLVAAAARDWGVPAAECRAQDSVISHASGKRTTYGKVAAAASTMEIPTDIALKSPGEWKIAGTSPARFDIPAKTNGSQIYASDVRLPGMLFASVTRSPVFGAKLNSYDESKAMAMRGVKQVVADEDWVAVVADNWWRANKALLAMPIEWDKSEHDYVSSESIMQFLRTGIDADDVPVAREDGDVGAAFANAAKVLEAEYHSGFLNHATMEPQNATALYTDDRLEVWCGTQNGETTAAAASETSGMPLENVIVHKMHAGGGFGRRVFHQDYTKQAVKIAMAMPGTPVRLQWSREEDMRQGRYRPISLVKLRGALDKDGNWTGWHVRQADQSIILTVRPSMIKDGIDPINTRCFRDNPYAVPAFLNEYALRNPHVPPGFCRAVAHTNNPFYRECFIDELAHAAGKDPYQFRRPFLQGTMDLPLLDAVAEAIGWGTPAAAGVHRGIAVVDSYGSFTAAAVELSVENGKEIDVKRVVIAIDPGHVVHPDAVKAQMEGGVIWGLSFIMNEEITIENGRVAQGNFTDYPVLKLAHTPQIETIIMPSGGFWGGVGEPPIGAVIPAIGNALFEATGERVRSMPLNKLGYSYKS
ncbi:MAG: xanthine dehydrogenase family protein molybdopterin-binding subunit [Betaproteobacteria bacterium]|nr:MAG: xanthine dehydrogenase family protein molybdopterin-binding subunit [Betaproteobacteria bacterium]